MNLKNSSDQPSTPGGQMAPAASSVTSVLSKYDDLLQFFFFQAD
jgi:hypothetical protein